MRKEHLIQQIKAHALQSGVDLTIGQISSVLAALEMTVAENLDVHGEITVPGLGKFAVKDTAPRPGRNPKTGEPIAIPAGKRVIFRAVASLRPPKPSR